MKRIPNMYSCMYVFLHMCVAVPACQYMPVCSISHYSYESCRFGAGAGGGASDEFRNQAFKLIPRIVEGNFMVKKAVGTKPAILGKKLRQIYIKTDRFFEIIVDIDSDTVARKITKLSLGYVSTHVSREIEQKFFAKKFI